MQKKFLLAGAVILLLASCDVRRKDKIDVNSKLTKQVEIKDPTTVQIIDSSYNFGKVTEGEIVTFNFRFKNTGTKPLIVTNANASCGCTVPERPEAPIEPGEESFIKVKFNSEKRVGQTHKTVTVTSNAEPPFPELLLTGEVMEKKK
jgi:LEA14-like dessication related protein